MDENKAQLALEHRIVEAFIEVIDQKIAASNGSTMRAATVELWPYILKKHSR
jgi:hypothetical protein